MLNKIIYTILGFGVAFIFFPKVSTEKTIEPIVSGVTTSQQQVTHVNAAPEPVSEILPPEISAKSALAIDLDSETLLYSKDSSINLPIASLTKLMTALVVVKNTDFNDAVIVDAKHINTVGINIGLIPGEQLTVDSLLQAMLIPSSNDAALILANHISESPELFAVLMNDEAKHLGLTASYYANPVGWDTSGGYSNTLDQVKVLQEFLSNPRLAEISKTKEATITSLDGMYSHKLTTTNKLLLENPEITGVKTGFTTKALGNLIITSQKGNKRVATIVLGSVNREEDSRKILDWVYQVYRW